jgi:hypothetical protein
MRNHFKHLGVMILPSNKRQGAFAVFYRGRYIGIVDSESYNSIAQSGPATDMEAAIVALIESHYWTRKP